MKKLFLDHTKTSTQLIIEMLQALRTAKPEEHYLLPGPDYTKTTSFGIDHALSDQERIVLYWTKKCRSLSFIQHQLQIDASALDKLIAKLQNSGIVRAATSKPEEARMVHYLTFQQHELAPEDLNLRYQWTRAVEKFADNTYAIDRSDNTFYTYKEFDEIVKYITSTLIQNNFSKGDRILLHGNTNFETIGLFWACMHLGIVFIPVNPLLPDVVIDGLIEKYNPKMIMLAHDAPQFKKWVDKTVFFDSEREQHRNQLTDRLYFSDWLKESLKIENLPEIDENDMCMIIHTSGSTGVPKGVKLAHGQLWQGALNGVMPYLTAENKNCLSVSNLDTIGGFRSVCFTLIAGGTCVIPSLNERNNPDELLTCIYETNTNNMSISPSLLNQLLGKKDVKARLAKMQCIMSVGSALTTQLKTDFFEKTNKRIYNVYGMTEAAGVLICEPLNSTNEKGNFIGYPVDCIIKIVDENNKQVKVGEIGELLLYGYSVFRGYYSDTEPNPNNVQQWYVSGDLVRMNLDGSLELTGRKKDFMKNARGEIVYFSEIEEALALLPFIKDVGVIAFFKEESERGALFIVLDERVPGPKNIVEETKKHLAATIGSNKIPAVIKVIERIPRTKYGKMQKTELQQYL